MKLEEYEKKLKLCIDAFIAYAKEVDLDSEDLNEGDWHEQLEVFLEENPPEYEEEE